MEQSSKTERTPVIFLLKSLLFSYILTGALLVILAFLLYKLNLSEKIVSAAIIVIYVAATFFAGFMTGKDHPVHTAVIEYRRHHRKNRHTVPFQKESFFLSLFQNLPENGLIDLRNNLSDTPSL